jgi:hypothetical protein
MCEDEKVDRLRKLYPKQVFFHTLVYILIIECLQHSFYSARLIGPLLDLRPYTPRAFKYIRLFLLIGVIVYFPIFFNGFVWDDLLEIINKSEVHHFIQHAMRQYMLSPAISLNFG